MLNKNDDIRLIFWGTIITTLIFLLSQPALPKNKNYRILTDEITCLMEENLAWNIQNELLRYFQGNPFIIKANVDLNLRSAKKRNLARIPAALLSKEIAQFPGAKNHPETHSQENAIESSFKNKAKIQKYFEDTGFRIKRIKLKALLDSAFTEPDCQFIYRVIMVKAELQPRRGDDVKIEVLSFPAKYKKEISESMVTLKEPVSARFMGNGFKAALILLIVLLAGCMLILLLFYLIKKKDLSRKSFSQIIKKEDKAIFEPLPVDQIQKQQLNTEIEERRRLIFNHIISTPEVASAVLKLWIKSSKNEGLKNSVIFIKCFSSKLLNLLRDYFSDEQYKHIYNMLENLPDVPDSAIHSVLQQFDRDFGLLAVSAAANGTADIFFTLVGKLPNDLRYLLLKDLNDELFAIALAQLPSKQSAMILKRIPEKQKIAVMAILCKIDKISLKANESLMKQLAERAATHVNMSYVTADGVETFANMLDELDEDSRVRIVDSIGRQDVDLAGKVRNKLVRFTDLIQMPAKKISKFYKNVDRELLATALVNLNESDVEKTISLLPEKMSEMLKISMEMKSNVDTGQVENARQQLVRSARNYLKNNPIEAVAEAEFNEQFKDGILT